MSEAGEPASPSAAAAESSITVAGMLRPIFAQTGTNNTARIGIVPKDVPITIVIKRPMASIIVSASSLLPPINSDAA